MLLCNVTILPHMLDGAGTRFGHATALQRCYWPVIVIVPLVIVSVPSLIMLMSEAHVWYYWTPAAETRT